MLTLVKCVVLAVVIAGAWYFYLRDQEVSWIFIQLGALWLLMREVRQFFADRRNKPARYRDDPHEFEDIPEFPNSRNSSHTP
jgi:membrane protein YdbS with pleckstrin-like domain